MKNSLIALALLFSSHANAYIDLNCLVELHKDGSKVAKTSIDRKAYTRLGKNLNVAFVAPYFDGETPVSAFFMIEDRNDQTKTVSLHSTVEGRWTWEFSHSTSYGDVLVKCD